MYCERDFDSDFQHFLMTFAQLFLVWRTRKIRQKSVALIGQVLKWVKSGRIVTNILSPAVKVIRVAQGNTRYNVVGWRPCMFNHTPSSEPRGQRIPFETLISNTGCPVTREHCFGNRFRTSK